MLIMISGMSGAGKSTALHALEDAGFFCTDNLPVDMLSTWAEHMDGQNAAVCVDIRSVDEPDLLLHALNQARVQHDWRMLFIDSSLQVLKRRFSILRRRHPFRPKEGNHSLSSLLEAEAQCLQPLKDGADLVLDSSTLNPYELADMVEAFWRQPDEPHLYNNQLLCTFMSFSYQRGLPDEADWVVDMRFLPNPHYQPALAVQTGRDAAVQQFFTAYPEVQEAEDKLKDWFQFIWPKLKRERKRYFTMAVGCSGGRHRSVYMAEKMAAWAQETYGIQPVVTHRELGITEQRV